MKLDPWKNKMKHENWKDRKVLKGISKYNSDLIIDYLSDMEKGYNVTKPGARSYSRLNNLRQRMRWMTLEMEKAFHKDKITNLTKKEVSTFFNDFMRKGKIKNRYGKNYISIPDYANVFKAFWHWYMKREDEKSIMVQDITNYIDISPVKESEFVYFTVDDLKKMANRAKFEYKVLMWFLFDSGIRAPTELMNVRVEDLAPLPNSDNFELDIREETSKTFGRKIKLMLCSQLVKEFVSAKNLRGEEYLFQIDPTVTTRYIRRLAIRVFGDLKTKGGQHFNEITLYDFRHSSACYWLPRYKSESALKYRFGWKENQMIHHYTKLLGMKDTIAESDMLLNSEAQTMLEKELEREKRARELLQEKYSSLEKGMDQRFKEMEKTIKEKVMKETLAEMKKSLSV